MSSAPKPPVKPAIKPKNLKFMRALFAYQAKDEDELTFAEGDLLYIVDDKSDKGWWRARCRGKEGLVPANFVSGEGNSNRADFNPMHDACRRGNLDMLQECLDNRAPINAIDKAGNTPLHWAAQAGQLHCVEKLLSVPQINLSIQNRLGDMPLHQAAYKGHVEIVRALRNHQNIKCDVNAKNTEGQTALDLAQEPETKEELKKWVVSLTMKERTSSVGDYNQADYADSDNEEE